MDLTHAMEQHIQWKVKLRKAILKKETLDATSLAKDNVCEFGKWLQGEGKTTHGKSPAYAECVAQHARFHVEAGKVAVAINAQKYTEAERALDPTGPCAVAGAKVNEAIMNLQKAVGK